MKYKKSLRYYKNIQVVKKGARLATWQSAFDLYFTVTCPEDYDGTVFQLGYSDMQINQANSEIDYSQPYMIDQLPGYGTNGHDFYYFSASDN